MATDAYLRQRHTMLMLAILPRYYASPLRHACCAAGAFAADY